MASRHVNRHPASIDATLAGPLVPSAQRVQRPADGHTMRSRHLKLVITLFAVVAMIPVTASPASAQLREWRGEVIRVSDGDTFDVRLTNGTVQTIRVAGINTNETNREPKCWADEATERLEELVLGRTVKLRARDPNSRLQGRQYRHVFVGSKNVAEEMLEEGYGIPFLTNDELDYADRYKAAFAAAQDAGRRLHDDDACGVGPEANISFYVNGDADGSDVQNPNGEYFQIRNHAATTLSLRGWSVHDSAVDYWYFPDSAVVPPGGRLTVHAGHGTDTSTHLYMGFDKQLYGPYDGAFLLDPDGDMRAFQHWPCDGFCGDGPVPDVAIEQVQADGPGNDNENPNVEWVRVVNREDHPVDLQDWQVTSYPYVLHITGSHVLAPGEVLTVFVGRGDDTRTELYWGKTASILGKVSDSMALWTPAGDVADCWAWGDNEKCGETPSVGQQAVSSDFDADGFDDLAIGIPKDDPKGRKNSGSVLVVPGAQNGVDRGGSAIVSQKGRVPGSPNKGDRFGTAIAVGDFNGDGYDDMAAGVPGEDAAGLSNSGAVNVLYGSRKGLRKAGSGWLRQSGAEANDKFGSALVSGDFNGDGYDDLAVGSPGENAGAGQVDIVYGSPSGLGATTTQVVTQSGPEGGDKFGSALAAGDFNGDGRDDLAIGAHGENANAGQVDTVDGSAAGLGGGGAAITARLLASGDTGGDKFAYALAAGDIDGDGIDDLTIGTPGDNVSGATNAGSVRVVFSSSLGLDMAQSPVLSQANLAGTPRSGDRFGYSVAVGDVDGDRLADIVIGVPRKDRSGRSDAGAVQVVYGGGRSMTANRNTIFDQDDAGGSVERGDRFGVSVRVLDVNGDNRGDIVAGASHEDVSGRKNHGSVGVIFGRSAGFSPPRGGLELNQSGRVPGTPKKADLLGFSLG